MGTLNEYQALFTRLFKKVKILKSASLELNCLFDKSATLIWQQDQIAAINALRMRISEELEREKLKEDNAEYSFSKSKVFTGVASFALGSLIGAMNKSESPLSLGAQLSKQELNKQSPFGNLMITFEDSDDSDRVEVVSVSRIAREGNATESKVLSTLRAKGLLLLSPQQFWKVLDDLKRRIIEGKVKPETPLYKELIRYVMQLEIKPKLILKQAKQSRLH